MRRFRQVEAPEFTVRATDFRPRLLLRQAHLQTIAGNYLKRSHHLPPPETVLVQVEAPPPPEPQTRFSAVTALLPPRVPKVGAEVPRIGSRVLCHCHWQPGAARREALTVIVLHGLEGSSNSQYVCGNADKLWYAGCNVVRMNMRNCGGTEALSPTLYHSGLSGDVLAVMRFFVKREGLQRVALVGYSMGGNLVLKLAGEMGERAPEELRAVAGISPVVDLGLSADALHEPANRIYERKFLKALLDRYRRKAAIFPRLFDRSRGENLHSIREFDERITAHYFGFAGADDYYERAASARVIGEIRVPTLVLHAMDDPFIRLSAQSRALLQENPWITLLEPTHGGHCAFLSRPDHRRGYDGYWAEHTLVQFLLSHAGD